MKSLFRRDAETNTRDPCATQSRRLSAFDVRSALSAFRQIGVEKAEHMRALDRADAFLFLQIGDALPELFHFRPVHFGPEMMLGVIAVVEEEPVVDFAVAAHSPGDRLVRVRAVMAVITVQVTEAVAKIPKRQKIEDHVAPVKQKHHEKRRGERGQFEIAPEEIAIIPLAQLPANRPNVATKQTQKHIAPRIFRFAIVSMSVNRKPIDSLAVLVLTIRVALVMLHVGGVVVCLGKTGRDRLRNSKEPIEQFRAEERVVNEVVPYAVDVGIDHQRVNESKDQHYPERRVRVKEEESQEISEMKQARRSWDRVPARVREEPGSCRGTLDADGVGRGHNFWGTYQRRTLVEVRHLASAGWAPGSDRFPAVDGR